MWFESLTGFREDSAEQVRANLVVDGDMMTSKANGRVMRCGSLEIPSLGALRKRSQSVMRSSGKLRLAEVLGDVQHLHQNAQNADALFQVASQFNLLEMMSPSVTPEQGVDIYERDRTQGPACAIACGAGTIFRNYFVNVNGELGQSADNQIDCLCDLGLALGNTNNQLWTMQNGYALASDDGLADLSRRLRSMSPAEIERLREHVRIGVQWNTDVTIGAVNHAVTQVYCSALPVAYSPLPAHLWSSFASLILEAAYEATMHVAVLNLEQTGNDKVYLTQLGGGAFGNREVWILRALRRALDAVADSGLNVFIVSHGSSKSSVRELCRDWEG